MFEYTYILKIGNLIDKPLRTAAIPVWKCNGYKQITLT